MKKSGVLFNTQGYKSTSINDITSATGFTKGAIYRHFKSKAALEKETLYNLSLIMFKKLQLLIKGQATAGNKLRAVFRFFESYISNPGVKGGCPLMNAAIEADDANPTLRREAFLPFIAISITTFAVLSNGQARKHAEFFLAPASGYDSLDGYTGIFLHQ